MPEYIERQKLFDALPTVNEDKQISLYGAVADFMVIASSIPTADLIEVVRCGECEHFHEYPYRGTNDPSGWGKCNKIAMDIDLTINDFCSYAEKKEGAKNESL